MKKQILWVFRESDTNAKRRLSQLKRDKLHSYAKYE